MKFLAVVIRGLRADMIGPYGNRWIDTPNLDILAAGGAVFDLHFSCHPAEAHAVWRTGRHRFRPSAGADLIPSLSVGDVKTCLVRDTGRGVPAGFSDGWTEAHACTGPEATLKRARSRLKALLPTDGWLLWAEFTVLPPWQVAGQFLDQAFGAAPREEGPDEDEEDEEETRGLEHLPEDERLEPLLVPPAGPVDAADDTLFLRAQSTMAAAVMQIDAMLGELLDGLPDDVTLLITSDQGVPLGEHGWMGPGGGLFDMRTHVPLMILGPGWRPGWRVPALTASIDLAPTLAGMFGVPLEADGASLLPLAEPGAPWPREAVWLGAEGETAVRTAEWLLRKPAGGPAQLYEKPADRYDLGDLSGPRFGEAEELERRLADAVG